MSLRSDLVSAFPQVDSVLRVDPYEGVDPHGTPECTAVTNAIGRVLSLCPDVRMEGEPLPPEAARLIGGDAGLVAVDMLNRY